MALAQYRFDHFILHAPCQHQVMFSIFFRQICLAPMDRSAPNALPPLFTLLSFGSGFKVQGSRFKGEVAASPPFLEDGILVSQPSPLGEGAPQGRIG